MLFVNALKIYVDIYAADTQAICSTYERNITMTKLIRATDEYLAQLTHHDADFVNSALQDFATDNYSDVTWWLDNEQNQSEQETPDIDFQAITPDAMVTSVKTKLGAMTAKQCMAKYENYYTTCWSG